MPHGLSNAASGTKRLNSYVHEALLADYTLNTEETELMTEKTSPCADVGMERVYLIAAESITFGRGSIFTVTLTASLFRE